MKCLSLICVATIVLSFPGAISGHSGRTDSRGGHHDRKNGGYHFHHGMGPHQHPGGTCPYASTRTSFSAKSTSNASNIWSFVIIGIGMIGIYNWCRNREDNK